MTSASARGVQRSADARSTRYLIALVFGTLALAMCAGRASAQQPTPGRAGETVRLSLDDALRMAQAQSHTIEIARTGVTRANGQRMQARSQNLPQLNATAAYGRTLASQFSSFAATATPIDTAPKPVASQSVCAPFIAATATAAERNAALAQAATCQAAGSGGFDLSKTSFGAKNQYSLSLAFSQNIYTAGRVAAQNDAADAQLRSANIEVGAQRAQVSLDVTSAYYDAVLADQFLAIADSSLAQTDVVLNQTKLARQVGNSSEYDLLRAQVTRDNQIPVRLQARQNRQVAYLRLKQLLTMPLDDSLQLTTGIEGTNGPTLPAIAAEGQGDTASSGRAPVRELDEAIRAQEAQVKIARAERIPSLSLVSNYQRLYFPIGNIPALNAGVNNWTLGFQTSFPILDGGRIKGDQTIAQAGVVQARAQRDQTRDFAALDTRVAITALREAEASWEASRGTADQAQRAYAIDEVRYREGISTQTDLSASRLLLEQAKANRAQAARNLAVARVRLTLIRDLPIQATSGATTTNSQQQQQRTTGSTQPATGGTTGGTQP
jgi:outer membrane protein